MCVSVTGIPNILVQDQEFWVSIMVIVLNSERACRIARHNCIAAQLDKKFKTFKGSEDAPNSQDDTMRAAFVTYQPFGRSL